MTSNFRPTYGYYLWNLLPAGNAARKQYKGEVPLDAQASRIAGTYLDSTVPVIRYSETAKKITNEDAADVLKTLPWPQYAGRFALQGGEPRSGETSWTTMKLEEIHIVDPPEGWSMSRAQIAEEARLRESCRTPSAGPAGAS